MGSVVLRGELVNEAFQSRARDFISRSVGWSVYLSVYLSVCLLVRPLLKTWSTQLMAISLVLGETSLYKQ